MRRRDIYDPRDNNIAILDRALEMVREVPYKVSLRWLFYRLLQEGYYSKKSHYNDRWSKTCSRARHAFYKGWRPDTLADETRERIVRGSGEKDADEWIESLEGGYSCILDKWYGQDHYVELWYEARAMTGQFKHYTQHITLVPMGGNPSIPYRWDIAKDLEFLSAKYDLPVVILYFGDHDPAGDSISNVVESTVSDWCNTDFEFIHCGLTLEQVQQYNIPENFEKPGQYQWEALSDEGAREIITSYTDRYVLQDAFTETSDLELEAESFVEGYMAGISDEWKNEKG